MCCGVQEDGEGRRLETLNRGRYFGERALIDDAHAKHYLLRRHRLQAFVLDKSSFRQALQNNPSFRHQVQSVYFQRQKRDIGSRGD